VIYANGGVPNLIFGIFVRVRRALLDRVQILFWLVQKLDPYFHIGVERTLLRAGPACLCYTVHCINA